MQRVDIKLIYFPVLTLIFIVFNFFFFGFTKWFVCPYTVCICECVCVNVDDNNQYKSRCTQNY